MQPLLVDTHAHLDMESFEADRDEVIARARSAGVDAIISVGTGLESSRRAITLANSHAGIYAAVGFHPHDASGVATADIDELGELARQPRVVALGEMGLDFYRNRSPRQAQLQVLAWQLELATKLTLPVIIHCRQAEQDILPVLREWTTGMLCQDGRPRGVIHCFSGNRRTAQQYLDMGFFLALGGYISYPGTERWSSVISSIPADRLVVETDCPYLPPQTYRGQRNEPAYVALTVRTLAEIRREPIEQIAEKTTENARRLFGLD